MEKSIVLAIETSSLVSSVAIVGSQKVYGELTIENQKHHSERLIPNIEKLFEMSGIEKKDLSAIAVSIGPGSFTGLRIGVATAKAIAYVLNIPVIGISTLSGLSWNLFTEGALLCPMMDAQKGNVYSSLYEVRNGRMKEIKAVEVEPIKDVLIRIKDSKAMILGEGNSLLESLLKEYEMEKQRAPIHLCMPRAASIGSAALERLRDKDWDSVMDIIPEYIRRSEAEELWEKKQVGSVG